TPSQGITPTQTPTGTFDPTETPVPSVTPPTLTPTPTASTPVPLGVTIAMPSHDFTEGDTCWLRITIHNPDLPLHEIPLFVILSAAGNYWCAPGWKSFPDQGLDYYILDTVETGNTPMDIISPFIWPGNTGSASGLAFYTALTDPEITRILGTYDVWEFAFR
ncbi:hypothetical protein JW979_08080, partial [bacterium]|nr:hypothetical protein [candidate division CSSED10-310 bacterium]